MNTLDSKAFNPQLTDVCNKTVLISEKMLSEVLSSNKIHSELIVSYYDFSCELIQIITVLENITLTVSHTIQQADLADKHDKVAELYCVFELCTALRKNFETFLETTESVKNDTTHFLGVLKSETDTLMRKALTLKRNINSNDLL